MAEYSKILDGYFTSDGNAEVLKLPVKPDMIEIWNLTAWASATDNDVYAAVGFANSAAGTAYTETFDGAGDTNAVRITASGFTFFTADTPTFGPTTTSTAGTPVDQANPANVHSVAHGLTTGDVVWIYGTTGMLQIAGVPYVITRVDADNFTIPVDSSGFAAAATSVSWKKVLYPDLYLPQNCVITNITAAAQAVVTTNIPHGMVVGQEVHFTIPTITSTAWGMIEMNGLKGYVVAVTSNTLTVDIDSSAFTAFAYPTSAQAAAGITFAQVTPIGDQNFGLSAVVSPLTPPITIPGAFYANTSQGVIIGTGVAGTAVMHATSDVVRWRATFPDAIILT